ncbi:RDD family protein [Knoellia locipacati]|uniref:RDD family protein n=1 Tax=Knoellia locipacati TaxID=882824 RepID=UPI0038503097
MSQPFDPNQPSQDQPPQDPAQPPAPERYRPEPPTWVSEPGGSGQQPYAGQPPAAGAPGPSSYQPAPGMNPYGGGGQAWPGSKAYVEQHFGPVAGFGSRAGALIIDTLLTLIGLIPFIIGTVLLVVSAPETDELGYSVDGTANGGLAATGGILMFIGVLAMIGIQVWNRIFKMGRTGQSVGKKMLGLKLVNEQSGQPIGAMQSFLRELLGGLINQIFYLSYLWMLWDDNKQTLADKVVHSTVIEVPKS